VGGLLLNVPVVMAAQHQQHQHQVQHQIQQHQQAQGVPPLGPGPSPYVNVMHHSLGLSLADAPTMSMTLV
jgi:hypothetical protein